MAASTYFGAQAFNNAWSNHRLLTACGRLSPEELAAERSGFFPSIVETLNHILAVDWFYVSALEGACVGYSAFDPEIPFPAIQDLKREQGEVDRRLIAVDELSEREIAWVDAYHRDVRETLTPTLDAETAAWLADVTRPLTEGA